ncbi:MAG: hypothetical protein U9R66_06990 [Thermodesulfobacteriota bacterium]|nr:hypothetical protein [Thermodesulfobacteriota bacterium]
MLQEMKQQLTEDIKKAKESGQLTAQQVHDITRDAVAQNAKKMKEGAKNLRDITKEAVTTTIQSLVDAEEAGKDKISAALHGAVDGIKQVESQILDTTHKEISQTKRQLQEKEAKLAEKLNEAFEGAREAAGNFTEKVKADIEKALADAKLKSDELRDTVKEAVHKAIEAGTDVEGTVVSNEHTLGEETKKLGKQLLTAAKDAASIIWGDAKTVFNKNKNKEDKS